MSVSVLRRLLTEATPGPWVIVAASLQGKSWTQIGPESSKQVTADFISSAEDAALIVALRNMADDLLALHDAAKTTVRSWDNGASGVEVERRGMAALRAVLVRLDESEET